MKPANVFLFQLQELFTPSAGNQKFPFDLFIALVAIFAGGIIWSSLDFPHDDRISYWLIFISAVTAYRSYTLNKRRFTAFSLILFFFFLGLIHGYPNKPPTDPVHIFNHIKEKEEVSLTGRLLEAPAVGQPLTRFLITVEELRRPDSTERVSGLVQLSMEAQLPPAVAPGDLLMVRAKIASVRSFGVPGVFDYQEFLGRRAIWVTGWVGSSAHVIKLHALEPPSLIERLAYLPEQARHRINLFIAQSVPDQYQGLYKAMLTGDRAGISPAMIENFNVIGSTHLLAISGLNIGLLAFLIITVSYWLLRQSAYILLNWNAQKIAVLLSLPPILGYTFIAGLQIPVVRSLMMIVVLIFAIITDRQRSIFNAVAIAAFLILLIDPMSLQTVSFQLSFAAVIGIALLLPIALRYISPSSSTTINDSLIHRGWHWLITCLAVSVAAMLGTLPLLLFYFNYFSLLSPISTLILEPFLCFWSLPFGLAGCFLLPFTTTVAAWLFQIGALGLMITDFTVGFMAKIPATSVWLPTPTVLEVICYYGALIFLVYWQRHLIAQYAAILSLTILILSPLVTIIQRHYQQQPATVSFLDVGQGSASVIEHAGRVHLIDGGGMKSDRFNVGERLIAPFLWKKRINRLTAVIVTHAHADHFNGLPFILEHFRPETLLTNGQTVDDEEYGNLLKIAAQNQIAIKTLHDSEMVFSDKGTQLRCLHNPVANTGPESQNQGRGQTDPNRQSLLLRLDSGPMSFLFPGDIYVEDEKLLVSTAKDIDADVLLAPHHGRKTSGSREFIDAVSPQYLVVSTSDPGGYRSESIVNTATVAAAEHPGMTILSTVRSGTITWRILGNTPQLYTFY